MFLDRIEWKESKTRQSILLKLLHKPEVMMEEVFDFLGARFVVHTQSDIPKLLQMLIENNIVLPHMVMGSRSRNSLLKVARARNLVNEVKTWQSMGILSRGEEEIMLRNIPWTNSHSHPESSKTNSFTSVQYNSLQFTMRYLVRIPNPAYALTSSLAEQLSDFRGGFGHATSANFRAEKLSGKDRSVSSGNAHFFVKNIVPQEIISYFPFEFQILDKLSYDKSLYGPASHERYKQAQLDAVRKRVLGGLLSWNEQKLKTQSSHRGAHDHFHTSS
jgi:uncharacterized protein (TIGR04562 family)